MWVPVAIIRDIFRSYRHSLALLGAVHWRAYLAQVGKSLGSEMVHLYWCAIEIDVGCSQHKQRGDGW